MSDIGILNDPSSLAVMALIFGSPGLLLGAVIGAVLWRSHRFAGAGIGAVAGFALWLAGLMWWNDAL
jgi:Na+/proline symporter